MYSMPVEVLAEILNCESKAFQKVADEKHNCVVPLNIGGHQGSTIFGGKHKENILP